MNSKEEETTAAAALQAAAWERLAPSASCFRRHRWRSQHRAQRPARSTEARLASRTHSYLEHAQHAYLEQTW
jgi:hypothetical protein